MPRLFLQGPRSESLKREYSFATFAMTTGEPLDYICNMASEFAKAKTSGSLKLSESQEEQILAMQMDLIVELEAQALQKDAAVRNAALQGSKTNTAEACLSHNASALRFFRTPQPPGCLLPNITEPGSLPFSAVASAAHATAGSGLSTVSAFRQDMVSPLHHRARQQSDRMATPMLTHPTLSAVQEGGNHTNQHHRMFRSDSLLLGNRRAPCQDTAALVADGRSQCSPLMGDLDDVDDDALFAACDAAIAQHALMHGTGTGPLSKGSASRPGGQPIREAQSGVRPIKTLEAMLAMLQFHWHLCWPRL
jgi:hypothetical protein